MLKAGYIDERFAQIVLCVPRADTLRNRLRRAWFCYRHRNDLKIFFLGLMLFDDSQSEEEKTPTAGGYVRSTGAACSRASPTL